MHFNKSGFFGHTCAPNFLSFFLCMPARGSVDLKMAFEKPLLVVNVFSDFLTGTAFWVSHG